ncbi:MAG TPA: isochorismatase family cysteine hydrolase [Acidobacteriota bacterium]|nr:isochorismatase family cysteine hydrolase [Acidobacteriota bacterium]
MPDKPAGRKAGETAPDTPRAGRKAGETAPDTPRDGEESPPQEEFINVDPLEDSYRGWVVQDPERFQREPVEGCALLCIDMQYLDAAPGHGVFAEAVDSGVPEEAQQYYFHRLEQVVLPNVRRLQDHFRHLNQEVIHVRIQSLTKDGRDRSPAHKRLQLLAAPGSKEADFLEQIAPMGDEIIINKSASGVFSATNLAYVLNNLDIETLFITGVYTDECVSTTIRDASDLGYYVILVEDACATVTEERHTFTVETLRNRYCRILSTEEVVEEVGGSPQAAAAH